MIVLTIYALDDTENRNIIARLSEGKHVIGRGDLLQVTDKRVSRKHAVLEVSSDKILLTSVHVNPCFFKVASGKTLSVLSQNQQCELNDGDQFALLPESCWFKIKITKKNSPEESLTDLDNSTAEINGKRHHDDSLDENDSDSGTKRARLPASFYETHNIGNPSPTSNINLEETNNVQRESSHEHQKCENLNTNIEEENTSLNLAETQKINDVIEENLNREIKKEPKECDENVSRGTSHNLPENDALNASDSLNPVIKNEPFNDSNTEGNSSENNILLQNNEIANDQPVAVKTENEDNNQNKDGASGSGTGPKKVYRERCWYGAQCFRKNPNHRESFSHPGDQDYESDPDDDRPDCPYGTTCYRKNSEHRKEYKHTGKPTPKPQHRPSGSPSYQNQSPNQKKPRKAAMKQPKQKNDIDSSEDDYDLEDPFINDASSDDFQPSDGIDSDSSWEDSQEVDEESQERNRMLREAKKFTRKGKKK